MALLPSDMGPMPTQTRSQNGAREMRGGLAPNWELQVTDYCWVRETRPHLRFLDMLTRLQWMYLYGRTSGFKSLTG